MSDNHGNTPAAWTAVTVGLLGFVVGGIGLMVGSMIVFWIGVALAPVALVVGADDVPDGLRRPPGHQPLRYVHVPGPPESARDAGRHRRLRPGPGEPRRTDARAAAHRRAGRRSDRRAARA